MSSGSFVASNGLDIIHEAINKCVEDAPHTLAAELISSKLKERGIRLSKANLSTLTTNIKSGKKTTPGDLGILVEDSSVDLGLTEDDLKKVETAMISFAAGLPELIEKQISVASLRVFKSLKKRWPKEFKTQEAEISEFRKRLFDRWSPGLHSLHMMLTISREIGASVRSQTSSSSRNQTKHLNDVITRLHARACQVTGEILVLLRAGFSEGALARWRTLHEISVTSDLIVAGGELLAKKYTDHQIIETQRAAQEYQDVHSDLGFAPISDAEMQKIAKSAAQVKSKYDKAFANPNGWAAEFLGRDRPTFSQIEKAVNSGRYRPHYRWASDGVHAGPKGIFKPGPLIGKTPVIMAGPTNGGLADPGHATAISLAKITANVAGLNPLVDVNIAMNMVVTLVDEAGDNFLACHNALMKEEEEASQQELNQPASSC